MSFNDLFSLINEAKVKQLNSDERSAVVSQLKMHVTTGLMYYASIHVDT